MNHQEYVINLIKKKYIVTKPPVRAILTHYLSNTKHRGIYIEFKQGNGVIYRNYELFINDSVGDKHFHNSPGLLADPKIADCLWFKECYDLIEELPKGLII